MSRAAGTGDLIPEAGNDRLSSSLGVGLETKIKVSAELAPSKGPREKPSGHPVPSRP